MSKRPPETRRRPHPRADTQPRPRSDDRAHPGRPGDRPPRPPAEGRADAPRRPRSDDRAHSGRPGDRRPSQAEGRADAPRRPRSDDRAHPGRPGDRPRPSQAEGRADAPRRPRSGPPELKVCGVNACLTVARRRPADIRRIYIAEPMIPQFRAVLKAASQARVAYHVVDDEELGRVTGSVHHEGICMLVRERPAARLDDVLERVRAARARGEPAVLLYLERVQNPHNLGAILRVCAHFGAMAVLACGDGLRLSSALARTAQGGAEWVELVPVAPGVAPLQRARAAGLSLIATSPRGDHTLLSGAPALPAGAVVMLGSEADGLSEALLELADAVVAIPGTGHLESLNVACAAAVALAEHWRLHGPRGLASDT